MYHTLRAAFLRSQRVMPLVLTSAVVRPARASNSARSAAEVGLLKEDMFEMWKIVETICFSLRLVLLFRKTTRESVFWLESVLYA